MIDEDEMKLLLIGSDSERARGVTLMHDHYAKPLWSYVLRKFPGLRNDIGGIVDETLIAVWKMAENNTLELNGSLAQLLFKIARNKAVDILRANRRRFVQTTDEDLFEVADRLAETEVGAYWRKVAAAHEAKDIQQKFLFFIDSLPPVQRAVAEVMAENFPDELGQEETTNEIYKRTGERPTVASVKRARAVIREKFKDYVSKYK